MRGHTITVTQTKVLVARSHVEMLRALADANLSKEAGADELYKQIYNLDLEKHFSELEQMSERGLEAVSERAMAVLRASNVSVDDQEIWNLDHLPEYYRNQVVKGQDDNLKAPRQMVEDTVQRMSRNDIDALKQYLTQLWQKATKERLWLNFEDSDFLSEPALAQLEKGSENYWANLNEAIYQSQDLVMKAIDEVLGGLEPPVAIGALGNKGSVQTPVENILQAIGYVSLYWSMEQYREKVIPQTIRDGRLLNQLVDWIPLVGGVKNVAEAAAGSQWLTGKKLSSTDRWLKGIFGTIDIALSLLPVTKVFKGLEKFKTPPAQVRIEHIMKGEVSHRITFKGVARVPPELAQYDGKILTPEILDKLAQYDGKDGLSLRGVLSSKASGGHHPSADNIEFVNKLSDGPMGTFMADIRVYDPVKKEWKMKTDPSSFFPETWSAEKVEQEILSAWKRKDWQYQGKWRGNSKSGLRIEGWLNDDGTIHGYPTWK